MLLYLRELRRSGTAQALWAWNLSTLLRVKMASAPCTNNSLKSLQLRGGEAEDEHTLFTVCLMTR